MNAIPQGDCAPVSALTALANANGFFKIVVRKKDLIITSGVNVNPTDVEHGLRHVEDVEDVWEEVKREHLEGHTRPRVIAIVPGPLPHNPRGKVLGRVLRDQQNTEAGCRARVRGTCGGRGGAGNRTCPVPWRCAYAGDLGWHARSGTVGLPLPDTDALSVVAGKGTGGLHQDMVAHVPAQICGAVVGMVCLYGR